MTTMRLHHFVGGERVDSGSPQLDMSPSDTTDIVGSWEDTGLAEQAVAAAEEAAPAWASTT